MSATDQSQCVHSPVHAPAALIDVDFRGRIGHLSFGGAVAVLTLILSMLALPFSCAGMLGNPEAAIAISLVAMLVGGVGCIVAEHRGRVDARETIALGHRLNTETIVRNIVGERRRYIRHDAIKAMAREFALAGRRGVSIRLCSNDLARPIEPIADSFEIRPLREGDPTFIELAGATGEPENRLKAIRARKRVAGFLLLAVVTIPVIIFFVLTWPRVGPMVLWIIPVQAVLQFGLYVMGWSGPTIEWYVVPGGLVLRTRFGPFRKQQLRPSSRPGSVVVVLLRRLGFWGAFVSDGNTVNEGLFSRAEAELLLRAWLSPAAPPTREHVEALL